LFFDTQLEFANVCRRKSMIALMQTFATTTVANGCLRFNRRYFAPDLAMARSSRAAKSSPLK
jgi:hypothetical protein